MAPAALAAARNAVEVLEERVLFSTFSVTNTADSGTGSLRQAITSANANGTGTDTINFAIPGTGVHTISPLTPLPVITSTVVINGYSQSGSSANTNAAGLADNAKPTIVLDGSQSVSDQLQNALEFGGPNSSVRGLVINNWQGIGVSIVTSSDTGENGNGAVVAGCFIGTDATGKVLASNQVGVEVNDADTVTVGGTANADRNIIAGSLSTDIAFALSNNSKIQNNFIGVDATGAATLFDVTGGGVVGGGVGVIQSDNNTIGGATASARNVIAGTESGLTYQGNNSTIQGNYVGTDVTGAVGLGNLTGVAVGGSFNTVSGNVVASTKAILGHTGNGLVLSDPDRTPTSTTGNTLSGNKVGTAVNGTTDLGNDGNGIVVEAASNNTITGNTVAFNGSVLNGEVNGGVGVFVNSLPAAGGPVSEGGFPEALSTGDLITSNSIHDNLLMGIDLAGGDNDATGPTPNDAGDADAGSNNLQNFPVLTSATSAGGTTTVQGSIDTTANTAVTIEFFSSPTLDAGGNAEGQTFLGSTTVTTGAGGRPPSPRPAFPLWPPGSSSRPPPPCGSAARTTRPATRRSSPTPSRSTAPRRPRPARPSRSTTSR